MRLSEEIIPELGQCPCDMCRNQDNENNLLERQKMDEICDIYSNYLIDYLLENDRKGILKQQIKEDSLKISWNTKKNTPLQ